MVVGARILCGHHFELFAAIRSPTIYLQPQPFLLLHRGRLDAYGHGGHLPTSFALSVSYRVPCFALIELTLLLTRRCRG